MRIKVVLFLALLSGLVFLFVRKPAAPNGPPADSPTRKEATAAQAGAAPAAHDESAHQHEHQPASANVVPTAPVSPEALWELPVTEPSFAAFKEWTQRHEKAGKVADRVAMEAEGATLARARLAALAGLIQSDPERAVELAVPDSVRDRLPASVRALLEERINTTGDYEVVCVLPAPGQSVSTPIIRSAVIGGVTHQVFAYGRALDYVTRKNVPLNGIAVPVTAATRLAASPIGLQAASLLALGPAPDGLDAGLDIPQTSPTAESPYTEGRKRYLLMRVDFPDYAGDVFPTNNAFQHMIDMSNFLAAISYNKHIIAPVGKGSDITPVMRMGEVASAYDNRGLSKLYPEARAVAQNVFGYDLSQYDFSFVCTGGRPAYGYAGLGNVGAVGYHLANGYFNVRTSAHELGHNLGLNHANWFDTGDRSTIGPGSTEEYGDPFDTMGGNGGGVLHFSASYKNRLGWIPPEDAITVTTSGVYRVHAHDITAAPFGVRGLRLDRLSGNPYWIEFRQLWTGNKALMNGVNFRWASSSSQLLDMTAGSSGGKDDHSLIIGRTFSDWSTNVHVTALRKGNTYPESIDLAIHFGRFPANQPPSVIAHANLVNATIGQTVTFSADASDSNGDALAYAWDFGDGDYSVDNAATTTHSFAAAGEYYVEVTVSDMKGGTARDSVIVNVGSPATFSISGRVLNHNGQPLSGIRVSVSGSRYAFSESDGTYTIARLAAGSHTVTAIEPVADAYIFVNPFFNNPVVVGPDYTSADFVVSTNPPPVITPLIARNSSWKFLDNGSNQGTAWRAPSFNDTAWTNGVGVLGYTDGDDQIDTTISFGPNSGNKYITTYFRRAFTVANPAAFTSLRLQVRRDDGVVVYLNGAEIFRDNMPAGAPTSLTAASGSVEPSTYLQQGLPLTGLLAGNNVIAAEIHQSNTNSSDAAFDLAFDGVSAGNAGAFNAVYLSSPASQQTFTNPPSILLGASARSTATTASQVDFYADGVKVGEDLSAPFSAVWSAPALGAHVLRVVALFGGNSITSAPVPITVLAPSSLAVEISAPESGATFLLPARAVVVAGVGPGPATVSNVRFFADGILVGQDNSAPYAVALLESSPGSKQILAVATDSLGNSATSAPVTLNFTVPPAGTQIISFGESWKYLDTGNDLGSAWNAPGFDDRLWAAGPGRLGYGGDGETTVLSFGPDASQRYITTYFRKHFAIADPSAFTGLLLRLLRDDGAVVHFNGMEVFRNNLPPASVNWNTFASGATEGPAETTPLEFTVSSAHLVPGDNVLAVEIHRAAIDSGGDLGFDLSVAGLQAPGSPQDIYFTQPAEGARFNGPLNISLATYIDAPGISSPVVQFFADGTFLGTATSNSPPYTFTWTNAPLGSHQLVAVFAAGNFSTSAPVNIVVGTPPPRIQPLSTNLIGAGVTWRYWDNVTAVGAGWPTRNFNDSAWPNGTARFGWGLDGEITTLTEGRVTHYFRRWFNLGQPALVTELVFQLARDDGAVVYLNGVELFRNNMPAGLVTRTTLAATTINTPDETDYVQYSIPTAGSGIVAGTNLVAVELHQSSATSSDAGFDLQLSGYGTTEPRVYLTTPADGAAFAGMPVINLEAVAKGVGSALVTNVEFRANGATIGGSSAAPWRFAWSNAPLGLVMLTAQGTDTTGVMTESIPIQIVIGREAVLTRFISSNTVWKYLDTGVNQGTAWVNRNFNDASWRSGSARLGFGGDGEATLLNGGPSTARFPTIYFRKTFVVQPGAIYTNLLFKLARDDGAVVHLNGVEAFRSNMAEGPVVYSTLADAADDEQTFFQTTVAITNLPAGTNLLAVEVHQSSATSSDLGFNLELTGSGYEDAEVPPVLTITLADGEVELRWPATAIGYQVYFAPTINTPANAWAPAFGSLVQVGGQYVFTITPGGGNEFFRLKRP